MEESDCAKEKAPCAPGPFSGSARLFVPELTPHQASDSQQTSSEQAQGTGFRHGQVGVAAFKAEGSVEEALARVARQLRRGTDPAAGIRDRS